jgi:hypothetical protein
VVLTHSEVDGRSWRYELATGAGAALELREVESRDALHAPLAFLAGHLVDSHGHALAVVPKGARRAALSPDQTRLAAYLGEANTLALGPLGGPLAPVFEGSSSFAWTRDGAGLFVIREHELLRVELEGGEARALASFEEVPEQLVAMPDGSCWLRASQDDHPALLHVGPEGEQVEVIHEVPSATHLLGAPVLDGTGERVAFVSSAANDCRAGDLWVVELGNHEARRTTESSCRYLAPDRGVDPSTIAALPGDPRFVALGSGASECSPSLGQSAWRCHSELYVLDPVAGERRRVSELDLVVKPRTTLVALALE